MREKWKNMKKSNILPKLDPNKILVDIDNYKFALYSIVVFEQIFKEIIGSETTQGKVLKTSATNEISPNESITPDLCIEVPTEKKPCYRAINEIKASFPQEKEQWKEVAIQLKKYDDTLTGWKYESDLQHDIMLTTDVSFAHNFSEYMKKLNESNELNIERNFSILECLRRERAAQQIFIRKYFGEISNKDLDNALSSGQTIAMYNILNEINKTKFYDANPPVIYMMMILWDFVFPRFVNSRAKFRDLNKNMVVELEITIKQMYTILSKFTPDSNPNCIKNSWIETALLWFQELGFVIAPKEGEKFVIRYKKHKEKTFELILNKANNQQKSDSKKTDNTSLDEYISK